MERVKIQQAEAEQAEVERAIELALAMPPVVHVPAGFAARVVAALPASPPQHRQLGVGTAFGVIAAAGLLVATFALAPHALPGFGSVTFDVEVVVIAELAGVVAWLAWRWESQA